MPQPMDDRKNALREQLRERRRARPEAERAAVDEALGAQVSAVPGVAQLLADPTSGCLTAYASYGTEPRTGSLRVRLGAGGVRVLLPVIRDDGQLDWAPDGALHEQGVSAGIPEPTTTVVATAMSGLVQVHCRVVLAPALAVDVRGHRIGKAGGYYDRLLAGLDDVEPARRPLVVAVVHDDEVLDEIPVEAHDRRVDAVLTPSGYRTLGDTAPV